MMIPGSPRCVSLLALTLAAALAPLGCTAESAPEEGVAEVEDVAEVGQALATSALVVAADGYLWQRDTIHPTTGNEWVIAGEAHGVSAMAMFNGSLYVASNGALWQRGAIGPTTGNAWTYAGDAHGVVAMAELGGSLYAVSNGSLWKRGAIGAGTGNDWTHAGYAHGVSAMATFDGSLYVVSNGYLWRRGAIGPGTGNDWTNVGEAHGVSAMTAFNNGLYVVSGGYLWRRGAIGPGTGNDWTNVGEAHGVQGMATLPAGAAAAPVSELHTNLALGKTVTQSSVLAGGSPGKAIDGNPDGNYAHGSVSHTALEAEPWWKVDLGSGQPIGQVVVFNRTDCCADRLHDYKVLVSDDDVTWDEVGSKATSAGRDVFDIDRGGRYVKVQLSGTDYLSLAEVQVLSSRSSSYRLCSWENGKVLGGDGGGGLTLGPWTGDASQLWQIVPGFSGRYELISRYGSQDRFLTDRTAGLSAPSLKVWSGPGAQDWAISTGALATRHLSGPVFGEYLEGGAGPTLSPWTNAERQRWLFLPATPTRVDAQQAGISFGAVEDVQEPPAQVNLTLPNPGFETPEWLVGEAPIPYLNVNDPGYDDAWKIRNNPYYKLSRFGFWKVFGAYKFGPGVVAKHEYSNTVGYFKHTTNTAENTLGITVSATTGFSFGGASASLSVTINRELKTTTSTTTGELGTKQVTLAREHSADDPETANVVYIRGDRYKLTAKDGRVVAEWRVLDDAIMADQNYPPAP